MNTSPTWESRPGDLTHMSEAVASSRGQLLLCILLWSLGGLVGPMLYPVLPDITYALGTSPVRAHLTVSLFFAGFALSHLLMLPLVDWLRLTHLIALSLVLFALSSIAAAVSHEIETVIAARFFQGLAYGVLPVAIRVWLCRDRTASVASRDLSIVAGVVFLVPIGTPIIGAALAGRYGWPAIFWLQALYAAAILWPFIARGLRDGKARMPASLRSIAGRVSFYTGMLGMLADRRSLLASLQMVLLYSLVMLLPFDIARVLPALSDDAVRDASLLVAASFGAVAVGSFIAARFPSVFHPTLTATFLIALALVITEWATAPSLLRFAAGTTLISVGLGMTVWCAMSKAMTLADDPSLCRSALLGFVQYCAAFLVVTIVSLFVPALPITHFASAALLLWLSLLCSVWAREADKRDLRNRSADSVSRSSEPGAEIRAE